MQAGARRADGNADRPRAGPFEKRREPINDNAATRPQSLERAPNIGFANSVENDITPSRDTLKKAENATVWRTKLLISP